MSSVPLSCPVRVCGRPLERRERVWGCPAGHRFDVARSGYVNLLQPQDRRAAEPGDARAVVQARARLLESGVGRGLIEQVVGLIAHLNLSEHAIVVDLGAGTGDTLAAAVAAPGRLGIGIDVSTAAVDHAARRHPRCTWVVANADRRLPLLDASVDLLVSVHARRNPIECRRVLKAAGHLVIAVPAADDLVELRAHVQGTGVVRDRTDGVVLGHAPFFVLDRRETTREARRLSRDLVEALVHTTYRDRASRASRLEGIGEMDVTFASDVLVFRAGTGGPPKISVQLPVPAEIRPGGEMSSPLLPRDRGVRKGSGAARPRPGARGAPRARGPRRRG